MNKVSLLPALVFLALSVTACNIKTESKKPADPLADLFNNPMVIKEGTYQSAITCDDKTKNKALPNNIMTFRFKADGTYTETVISSDPACKIDCSVVVEGAYAATESTFTFLQTKISSEDGAKLQEKEQSATFSVFAYAPGAKADDKAVLMIQNSDADNVCGGKMTWTMLEQ